MKYFKLIEDNQVLGVVSSNDFIYYSPIVDCFLRGNENNGQYISFQNELYRDTWMSPIRVQQPHTIIHTTEIDEQTYNIFMQAIEINQEIEEEDEVEEEEVIAPIDPIAQSSIEFIRSAKIKELSRACNRAIEAGFDLAVRGETYHFSLTTQDQLNLMGLSTMAQTQELIPYHADGEICDFYTAAEINQIIAAATEFKNYQIAYHNALKAYVNALLTAEEISAVTYGMEIPDEYKSDVLKILE